MESGSGKDTPSEERWVRPRDYRVLIAGRGPAEIGCSAMCLVAAFLEPTFPVPRPLTFRSAISISRLIAFAIGLLLRSRIGTPALRRVRTKAVWSDSVPPPFIPAFR